MAQNKFTLNSEQFLYGLSKSPTVGRGFPRLDGVDLQRELGYIVGGYTLDQVESTDIDKTPEQLLVDNSNLSSTGKSKLWAVADTMIYNLDLDSEPASLEFTSTMTSGFTEGAELYNDEIVVAASDKIGSGSLTSTSSATLAFSDTAITSSLNNSDAPHPMKPSKGNLYVLDGRYVGKYDGTTYDSQDLDLEKDWVGISQDKYGEFLAIGAVYMPDSDSGYGTAALFGQEKSRLYFWDTDSESWDKDRSTEIDGRLVWVKNVKGKLYTLIEYYAGVFGLGYFDGTTIKNLKKINIRDWDLVSASVEQAKDVMEDLIYFGIDGVTSGTYRARIMGFGKYDEETPDTLSVPYYFSKGVSNNTKISSLKWGGGATPSLYLGIDYSGSDGLYRIKFPWTGTGTPADYTIETPNISTDKKQILRRIRIIVQPLASGDELQVRRKINCGSWDSAAWKTFNYSTDGAETELLIDEGFEFWDLQLKLSQGSGDDIKIKSIIIESEDAE